MFQVKTREVVVGKITHFLVTCQIWEIIRKVGVISQGGRTLLTRICENGANINANIDFISSLSHS